MKAEHALILYALGLSADAIGALFKISHWAGADDILLAATALKVSGILLLTIKLLAYPRIKEFLNS
ncbi:hypothetical protein [Hymenobacter sp. IS2118]|uniref:hypothetical protein n=1 Tax=Hymenobacter sp. IS2118 TaxID=1505605 RepID=UPI00055286CF|nr:hypothetical protein [Hymenobacter sp. IS2118]